MSRSLVDLTPETRVLADKFLADCAEASIDIIVTCTFRSFDEQDALYAKGRPAGGPIVTNARGGESPHNYGLAFDVVPIEHGKPIWDAANPLWEVIGAIGVADGLEWGGNFRSIKDVPHFQMPGWKNYIGVSNVKQAA